MLENGKKRKGKIIEFKYTVCGYVRKRPTELLDANLPPVS